MIATNSGFITVIHKPRVLVVDNDENILSAFEDYLTKKNCMMVGVQTAESGIKKMKQQCFDLLITDIRANSDLEIKFVLQAKKLQTKLSVIAITSYPEKISESDLKMYGADYLFIKPLELRKLDKAVNNCLQLNYKKIS
jgi:two-component SAPR family response regulator